MNNPVGIYFAFWEKEWDADYAYYIDKVKRLGFDVLEIAAASLTEMSPQQRRSLAAAAREAGFFVAGVRDPLYAGREEEIQALCCGWVDDFRQVPKPLLKRVLGTGGQPAGRGSKQ